MSDSVRPHRRQPTRLPCPWDSSGKNTGMGCHFLLQCVKVKSQSEVAQSCPTLSDPMDCSLPGSSIHGIFQPRVLEWGARYPWPPKILSNSVVKYPIKSTLNNWRSFPHILTKCWVPGAKTLLMFHVSPSWFFESSPCFWPLLTYSL